MSAETRWAWISGLSIIKGSRYHTDEATTGAEVQAVLLIGPLPATPLEVLGDDNGAVPHCSGARG